MRLTLADVSDEASSQHTKLLPRLACELKLRTKAKRKAFIVNSSVAIKTEPRSE